MSNWTGSTLTRAGRALQAKVQAGAKLELTTLKLGDGTESVEDLENMVALMSPKYTMGISSTFTEDDVCTVIGAVSSTRATAGFYAREFGLYAKDPDIGEILYMVALDPNPNYVPPNSASVATSAEYALKVVVANAENVEVKINPYGIVTVSMLKAVAGDIVPGDSGEYELGSDGKRWKKVYSDEVITAEGDVDTRIAENRSAIEDVSEELAAHESRADSHKELFDGKADKLVDGHGVVRSVNNQYADDSGNVNLSGIDCGMIIPFAGNGDIPVGFLLCNGASVSRDTYADLFNVIGTTYGAVDDEHFNLPDLTGRFAEGADEAGEYKEAGLPNITGNVGGTANESNVGMSAIDGAFRGVSKVGFYGLSGIGTSNTDFDASRSNPIYGNSDTVQPPSITVRYIIKAFNGASSSTTDIEVTQLANDLADKANRSLSNTADNVDFVVESYSDEEGNWYRKYKSGWMEQGGKIQNSVAGTLYTINFLKPFKNTNYLFLGVGAIPAAGTGSASWYGAEVINSTTNRSTTGTHVKGATGISSWYACGQ